jgi:hypothetical protein
MLTSTGVWLHAEVSEGKHCAIGSTSNEGRREYQHERDVSVAAHAVTKDQLEQERNLRVIAEASRNVAMHRVGELLAKHMEEATNEEIAAATADLFAPIGLVRAQVPTASHADPVVRSREALSAHCLSCRTDLSPAVGFPDEHGIYLSKSDWAQMASFVQGTARLDRSSTTMFDEEAVSASMKFRSFTVPPGKPWMCIPPDGDGLFKAEPGEQVVIVSRQTWDEAFKVALIRVHEGEH